MSNSSKYDPDAVTLFRILSDIKRFGFATPEGFEARKQFVIQNQDWIQRSPDHQMMPAMALPDLLPWIDNPLPTTLFAALKIKPAIVHYIDADWLRLADHALLELINHSTVFSEWFSRNHNNTWHHLTSRGEYNPPQLDNVLDGLINAALTFPEHCVYQHFKNHTNVHWNDLRKHPFASHVDVKAILNKFNQVAVDIKSVNTIPKYDKIADVLNYCRVHTLHNHRPQICLMDDQDNLFTVISVPINKLKMIVESDVVDNMVHQLQYKNYMNTTPDDIVLGWIRYSRDVKRGVVWIDEVQSRLRFDNMHSESSIPHSEWKQIEQHLLSFFLKLVHQSFGDTVVWLPTIKHKHQSTQDQPSEVYAKFPKRIGFSKEIVQNVGSKIDGTKCWRIKLDSEIL